MSPFTFLSWHCKGALRLNKQPQPAASKKPRSATMFYKESCSSLSLMLSALVKIIHKIHGQHEGLVSQDSCLAWILQNILEHCVSTIERYGTLKISHLLLTKSLTSELLLLFIWLIDAAAVASRNFRFNSATLAVCFDEN